MSMCAEKPGARSFCVPIIDRSWKFVGSNFVGHVEIFCYVFVINGREFLISRLAVAPYHSR